MPLFFIGGGIMRMDCMELSIGEKLKRSLKRIFGWLTDGLEACEGLLSQRPATRFAYGDAPGLADICLVPQMYNARRAGVMVAAMPLSCEIDARLAALPAFARALPEAVQPR